jgi:hypothetical protein
VSEVLKAEWDEFYLDPEDMDTAKRKKYVTVSEGEKDLPTVAKITRLLARFDAPSNELN